MNTKRYLALVMALVMAFSLVVPVSAEEVQVPSAAETLNANGNTTVKMTVYAADDNGTKVAAEASINNSMNATLKLNYGSYAANSEVTVYGQTKNHANLTTFSLGGTTSGSGIDFDANSVDDYFPGLYYNLDPNKTYQVRFVNAMGATSASWDYTFKYLNENDVTLTLDAKNGSAADEAWDELREETFIETHNNKENSFIKLAAGSYLQMDDEKLTVNSDGLLLDDFSNPTQVNVNIDRASANLTYTSLTSNNVYQLLLKEGTQFSLGASIAQVKQDLLVTMTGVSKNHGDGILNAVYTKLNTSNESGLAESLLAVFSDIAGLVQSTDSKNPVVITFGKPYTATNTTVDEENHTITDTSTAITVDTTQPTPIVNLTTEVTITNTSSNVSNTTITTKPVAVDTDTAAEVAPNVESDNSEGAQNAKAAVNAYSDQNNQNATFKAALAANDNNATEAKVLRTTAAAKAIATAAATLTPEQTETVTEAKVILQTKLTGVAQDSNNKVTSVTYDITPVAQLYKMENATLTPVGNAVELNNEDIVPGQTFTFSIPVPSTMTANQIKVTHDGEFLGTFTPTGSPGGVRYVTVTVSHFSMFELEPVVTESSELDVIYTLDLASEISINLYVKGTLTDNTTSTADYTIYYGPTGVEHQSKLSDTTWLANSGYYKIVIGTFHAKQMGDEIKVIIKDGDDQVFEKVYSIKSYCNSVIDNAGSGDKLKNLCKAVLDYGAYSQLYFKHNTDYLVNGGNYTISLPETIEPAYMGTDGDFNGVTALKTLDLKSQVELIFYFRSNSNESITVDSVTTDNSNFTGWTKSTTPLDGGYTKVAISGIPSRYLNEKFNVTVTCGGQTGTWSWSAMSFAYATQNSETVGNVVKALFNYYTYADAYFKK